MVVSVPHFGIEPLPGIGADHYREPGYVTFPRGYTDVFAAEVYGNLHQVGASLVATPYSRLFVDVNRRRDDFERDGAAVVSGRGVVRTHVMEDRPIFSRPLGADQMEDRLRRFYDPYHAALDLLVREAVARFGTVVVLDAHTASPRRIGDHEVVIGSRRGETAAPRLVDEVAARCRAHGFRAERDVPGYSGGYITRRFGRTSRKPLAGDPDRDQRRHSHVDDHRGASRAPSPRPPADSRSRCGGAGEAMYRGCRSRTGRCVGRCVGRCGPGPGSRAYPLTGGLPARPTPALRSGRREDRRREDRRRAAKPVCVSR